MNKEQLGHKARLDTKPNSTEVQPRNGPPSGMNDFQSETINGALSGHVESTHIRNLTSYHEMVY